MAQNIVSSVYQSRASNKAADAQREAAGQAIGTQIGARTQARSDLEPYLNSGTAANNQLSYLLGLSTNPGTGKYSGVTLVDNAGGKPMPNAGLYASDPAYKAAWDSLEKDTISRYGQGHTADSPVNGIKQQLEAILMPSQSVEQASSDPLYGSLAKSFSMSDFEADPGYQFRFDEGQKALERTAAARGGLLSGSALKASTVYGQNAASDEYQNAYNRFNQNQRNLFSRLSGLSGSGQNAANTLTGANQNTANAIGGLQTDIGNVSAQNYVNQGNIWSSGINGVLNKAQQAGTALLTGGASLAAQGLTGGLDPRTGITWNTGRY